MEKDAHTLLVVSGRAERFDDSACRDGGEICRVEAGTRWFEVAGRVDGARQDEAEAR